MRARGRQTRGKNPKSFACDAETAAAAAAAAAARRSPLAAMEQEGGSRNLLSRRKGALGGGWAGGEGCLIRLCGGGYIGRGNDAATTCGHKSRRRH